MHNAFQMCNLLMNCNATACKMQTVTQVGASSPECMNETEVQDQSLYSRSRWSLPHRSSFMCERWSLLLERDLSSISGPWAPSVSGQDDRLSPRIPHWLRGKLQVNIESTWQCCKDSSARPETPASMWRSSLTASCFIQLMDSENQAWVAWQASCSDASK